MGLFSNFFRSSESSSDVAKRRLKVDIKVTKTELDETSGTVNALLANIPIKEGSRNFRK